MVSTALASARTKSIETGQSWGVEFTPFPNDSRQVGTLHFVRVTSPYTGTGENNVANGQWGGPYGNQPGTLKLNYAGKEYRCPDDGLEGSLSHDPPPDGSYDFQFYPAPKKSSLMPIQLPSRAVVDIKLSGIGDAGQFAPSATVPVRIMFTPTGDFVQIFHPGEPTGEDLDDNAYLFVGKAGRTTASADIEDNHLIDGEAIWISLSPRNGSVTSAENKPPAAGATDSQKENYTVNDARTWARE